MDSLQLGPSFEKFGKIFGTRYGRPRKANVLTFTNEFNWYTFEAY
jgi:hypothetical protein